jgi:polygalacturonase
VRLTDYGAVGDGHTSNTAAFEAAIADVSAKGGGRVIVPPGLWRTGPIVLRSRLELHLERGALIQFSDDRDDYALIETSYEGRTEWRCQSPISGRDLEHVAITGEGIFDGAGQVWRPVKRMKMTARQWSDLLASGGVVNERGDIWYPSAASLAGNEGGGRRRGGDLEATRAVKDALRPVMLSLVECRYVLLEGVTFQNSPAWCLHPLMCEELTVRGVKVRNPWYSQNGDGLDLESCRNALVEDCSFDVGDDAICLKSGRDAEGRRRGRPTENVLVRNCVVYHGHGGFVVGSEMSGGVRNIRVRDCTFIGTDVGLRFKSTRGRGGVVENIHIERVQMTGIPTEAILFDLFYGGSAPTEDDVVAAGEVQQEIPPVSEETPAFRNIVLRDIVCRGARRAALLRGLPEMPLQNVRIESTVLSADTGIMAGDIQGLELSNVRLSVTEGVPLSLRDARDVKVEKFEAVGGARSQVRVAGVRTQNIRLQGVAAEAESVAVGTEVPAGAVRFE